MNSRAHVGERTKMVSSRPSPCLLRKPSLSHVNGESHKTMRRLPFSALVWEKVLGVEGFLNMLVGDLTGRPYEIYRIQIGNSAR